MKTYVLLLLSVGVALVLVAQVGALAPAPGHPGGFYLDIVATGYGVKIVNVDGDSHISPDNLSAQTKLWGNVRSFYTVNYTLQTKGMNIITVQAPRGVEVAFKPRKYTVWKAEVIGRDHSYPSFGAYTKFKCDNDSISNLIEAWAQTEDFNIKSYSNGSYSLQTAGVRIEDPDLNNQYLYNYTKATYKEFSNSTYVGYVYNLTSYMIYNNTTSGHIHEVKASMNITAIVRKDGREALVIVDYYAYAYRNRHEAPPIIGEINSSERGRFIFKVNETGWYIDRTVFEQRGGHISYDFATSLPASGTGPLNMSEINKNHPAFVIKIGYDSNEDTFAILEIGKYLYMSVDKLSTTTDTKIHHIRPGVWAFSTNGNEAHLTMYIYPHPMASGYGRIFVTFTRQ